MASGRQGQGCSALESLKAASEGTERPPDGTAAQWVRGLAAGSRLLTSPIVANHRQQKAIMSSVWHVEIPSKVSI